MTKLQPTRDDVGPLGVLAPPDIAIACAAFQGSLGMLFQCVRKRKVDLVGVPLAPICEAYFHYLVDQAHEDLDRAAVALAALAYLLERKAWLLLPSPECQEPQGDDVLEMPEPYAHEFVHAIEELMHRHDERSQTFFRSNESNGTYEMPFDLGEASALDLARAFERIVARAHPDPIEPPSVHRRSLGEQMSLVLGALSAEFQPLDDLVAHEFTRSEVVWWFLALLELIRIGQARVKLLGQEVAFARGEGR